MNRKAVTIRLFKDFENEIIPRDSIYLWTERKIKRIPSWKDLTDKRIAIPQEIFSQVLKFLEYKHFCIVVGGKDTGKSWLSYIAGHHFVSEKKRDVRLLTVDNNFNGEKAWNEIISQEAKGKNKPERYFIIEDCHINPQESEIFFENVLSEREENLRFLFSMRKTGKYLIESVKTEDIFFNKGNELGCMVQLEKDKSSKEHIKNIIRKFVKVKKINYDLSEQELEAVTKRWKTDLYWVWLRLNSWEYNKSQKLADISDIQIFDSIWRFEGEIKLILQKRRKVLLPISIFCQHEPLKVSLDFLTKILKVDELTLRNLIKEGILVSFEIDGYDFVSMSEGLARVVILTILKKDPFITEESYKSYILKIFKQYLKSKPSNWNLMFQIIYSRALKAKSELFYDLLLFLLNDDEVWKSIKEKSSGDFLYRVIWFLPVLIELNIEKAKELWDYYIQNNNLDSIVQQFTKGGISSFIKFFDVNKKIKEEINENVANKLEDFSTIIKDKLLAISVNRQIAFLGILLSLNPNIVKSLLKNQDLIENLKNKLKSSTANTLRKALIPLSRAIELDKFLEDFSISNWEAIINSSTINSVRTLLYTLWHKWKTPSAVQILAEALPNAELDILLSRSDSSLYRLNGLIGNLKQISQKETERLLKELSELDLSYFFLKKDSEISKYKRTKAECINWLLANSNLIYPYFLSRAVNRINNQTWSFLINNSSFEDSFWLVWSIYRGNQKKAKLLIKDNIGKYLISNCNPNTNRKLYLPLLGLLRLCEYSFHSMDIDLKKTLQIVNEYKKEKNITLLVLSLVFLKEILHDKNFKTIAKHIDQEIIRYILNPRDIQLKPLFYDLMKNIIKIGG